MKKLQLGLNPRVVHHESVDGHHKRSQAMAQSSSIRLTTATTCICASLLAGCVVALITILLVLRAGRFSVLMGGIKRTTTAKIAGEIRRVVPVQGAFRPRPESALAGSCSKGGPLSFDNMTFALFTYSLRTINEVRNELYNSRTLKNPLARSRGTMATCEIFYRSSTHVCFYSKPRMRVFDYFGW